METVKHITADEARRDTQIVNMSIDELLDELNELGKEHIDYNKCIEELKRKTRNTK